MALFGDITESLFETSGTLVALFDPQDILRRSNAAYRETYGVAANEEISWAEILRRNFEQRRGVAVATEDFEHWLTSARSRRGKSPYRAFETDVTDGRWLWMTETVSPTGWMLCIASDITELRTGERSLRQDRDSARKASQTDELTGISNRRYCMSVLQETIAKASLGEVSETCVALLDIDRFKQINDRFGHQFGDAVLIDFGKSVQRNLRPADSFGRVGGEEFLLILPQLGPAAAELLIERLFRAVGRPGSLPSQPGFHYSFSAGLTQIRPGDTLAEVYHRADAALYDAKVGGRGRQMSA
ncbi:diguanylate cyclase [Bosea sp. Tri-44]|uniref:sensor domain-containing diguanylate cyclase n=1 Tax=Bosea sp. Tri-44 TaxID=1972137 RepID=UPI00100F92D9|nr:GGDEF domain-containing protein [Bosea sp. Tri-44]RXT46433.1 diguanylate cyclase [Bosea sp. Tri-44]